MIKDAAQDESSGEDAQGGMWEEDHRASMAPQHHTPRASTCSPAWMLSQPVV